MHSTYASSSSICSSSPLNWNPRLEDLRGQSIKLYLIGQSLSTFPYNCVFGVFGPQWSSSSGPSGAVFNCLYTQIAVVLFLPASKITLLIDLRPLRVLLLVSLAFVPVLFHLWPLLSPSFPLTLLSLSSLPLPAPLPAPCPVPLPVPLPALLPVPLPVPLATVLMALGFWASLMITT